MKQKCFRFLRALATDVVSLAVQALSLTGTLTVCLSFILNANAQNSTRTIEVASIRIAAFPSDDYFRGWTFVSGICSGARSPQISGNVVTLTRFSLCQMLGMAYAVQDFRITGVPEPMLKTERTNFYDVRLKAEGEGALTAADARDLLKELLADRFQLKVHMDTKITPVYELTVGKNGTKLKVTPEEGRPNLNGVPMTTYVGLISKYVDRPIVDRTGLTDIHYAYQWNETELRRDLKDGLPVPSIFREVDEQLGLNLKPTNAPFEVLVIDHAEPPSEN